MTQIVSQLLKDPTAPKELHRSVLKFIKIVITYFDFIQGSAECKQMNDLIITHVFSLDKPKRFTIVIRRILSKLISRNGLKMV